MTLGHALGVLEGALKLTLSSWVWVPPTALISSALPPVPSLPTASVGQGSGFVSENLAIKTFGSPQDASSL